MNQTLAPPEPANTLPRPVLVEGKQDLNTVTDAVCKIVEQPPPRGWWPAFGFTGFLVLCAFFCITYLVTTGIGVWGLNSPVGWAFDITNFVFWVGIGHAGTLISAILLLLRQKWRTSINRFAEAMTLFAVLCAAVFPTIHVGRIWMLYFFAPVPNSNDIWPNFRSPLLWDMFALSTYGTVSLLFWYVGLIPDLATLRDRATTKWRQYAYGVLAMGWRGSGRHWRDYELACLILAGIATPLVVSVHTIVSFDFATSVIPGWHATIFPPYFVAGAIFSGFAMVLTLMIPVRQIYGLKHLITDKHLDNMCKVILATGMMVGFAYATEFFMAWYGGDPYEQFTFLNRAFGPYGVTYWIMVSCNVLAPQVFWIKKYRYNPWLIFGVSILVNVGMWFERFVIIVTSLHRDRLVSSWGMFYPTWVDLVQMVGVFGLFFLLVLIFLRVLPMIAISEVKMLLPEANPHHPPENNGQITTTPGNVLPFEGTTPGAVVARFTSAAALLEAAKKTLAAGYKNFDTHSPFPIHGMDRAMGMSPSKLPWMVLAGGITGCVLAMSGMLYVNVIDYPLITGGKPYGALEPLMPITFEVTVLLSAFATVGGLFFLCGLPRLYHTLFRKDAFARATSDGFFLSIEAGDPLFNLRETPAFLASLGGTDVTVTEAQTMRWIGVGMVLVVALVVAIFGWRGKRSSEPPIQLIPDMKQQPIYHAQGEGAFFADRREMRKPVEGTVPFGGLNYAADAGNPLARADLLQEDDEYYRGRRSFIGNEISVYTAATTLLSMTPRDSLGAAVAVATWNAEPRTWVNENPVKPSLAFLDRGQDKFNMSCALCHGLTGRGNGITTQYEMKGVANLHEPRIREMPDGQLFNVVVHGKGNMKGYGWLLKPEERWAVVAYVRVLQRSQRATEADLPPQERERLKR